MNRENLTAENLPEVRENIKLPVFYLLLAGSFAGWQSLYNVHLDTIGYSSIQIGALNAIFISTSALVVPFWGVLADKFGNNRVFLLLTSLAGLLVFLIGQTLVFQWMVIFIFLISVFHQPGGAVLDGMTMGFVRRNPHYSFGHFRLWNSAGYGIAISPLYQFLNLYYKDIGSGNDFIGLIFFVQAMFEIPSFLLGVRLVKRKEPEKVILFSMLISMLRMGLYGFISDPLTAAGLSLFHGITIAFFIIGVVEYVQRHTPNHLRTTGQALIWAFHFGAGVALGNLLLGYIRDHGGLLKAMHVHAILAAAVLAWTLWFFKRYSLDKESA